MYDKIVKKTLEYVSEGSMYGYDNSIRLATDLANVEGSKKYNNDPTGFLGFGNSKIDV